MKMIKFQPARHTDFLTEDGQELTKLPYPFVAQEDGTLLGPRGFRRIVGFARQLDVQQVDLLWAELADPQVAKGMYLVTEDDGGTYATHLGAVDQITEQN